MAKVFSISPSNEYARLLSFRINWSDLLAVQGTLKGLLQHHSSKASILWVSAFFMVQLSHQYMTPGENIALTIWVHMSFLIMIFSEYMLNIGIAGSYASFIPFFFLLISIMFFTVAVSVYIPTNSPRGFLFLHTFPL